jgi:L-threonylcarbamoyladenylate synthase
VSALTISTRVVAVDPMKPDESVMRAAGARVQKGGLVAFPTESFYGLGADALDPAAVARVFEVKGRPDDKPLLVLVDSIAMAADLAAAIPDSARADGTPLAGSALTLVLGPPRGCPPGSPAAPAPSACACPGTRWRAPSSSRPRGPVTAPSANPSAAPPHRGPRGAVRGYFDGRVER